MAESIRVVPTTFGTADWRVEFADGKYVCDIRLEISSMMNASRYYVLTDGQLAKEGTFNFDAWDYEAAGELLSQIVRSMYPSASVDVRVPQRPSKATGT